MKVKPNIDLLSVSSLGVRLTPFSPEPVHTSHLFSMQATSAETNVLTINASLGLRTRVLTKFVKDSPIASFIQKDLQRRGIEWIGPSIKKGGPWGYRHQINIADSGYGFLGPIVTNDRAGEVGRTLSSSDFSLEELFHSETILALHLSGLIASLSKETGNLCNDIVTIAKQHKTQISFDLNYRASFWHNRKTELSTVFQTIASKSDILIGNEEDFQLCLDIKGPEAGGNDIDSQIYSYKEMIKLVQKTYPNVSLIATTLRQVIHANEHLWGALMYKDDSFYLIRPEPIQVKDRIGGGDGFVGGLLYGLNRGFDNDRLLQFAWASGAYVATLLKDYGEPLNESQIWNIWNKNARVKR